MQSGVCSSIQRTLYWTTLKKSKTPSTDIKAKASESNINILLNKSIYITHIDSIFLEHRYMLEIPLYILDIFLFVVDWGIV
jgi:hypothetical protein